MKTLTYQFHIGEYQGHILYDNFQVQTVQELVVNPIVEELEPIIHEYAFEITKIPVGYNNLLLRACDQNILVDAGIRRPIGQLCLGLKQLKIDPGSIDTIIITHSDMDHIGGVLNQDGEISFPNARYIMLADSWQHWTSKKRRIQLMRSNKWTKEKAQFVWETYSKIKDLILLVKPEEEFIPGFRLIPAPGHRLDHSILKLTSSDEQLIHISDAIVHPLFMGNRDWYSTYDANPAQAIDSKIKLLNMCVSENSLLFGSHFPFPGLGYVQQGDESWKWEPVKVA